MPLSDKAIQEFKEIWKDEYGEDLSDAEAKEHALRVLGVFRIVTSPLPKQVFSHKQCGPGHNVDNNRESNTMKE